MRTTKKYGNNYHITSNYPITKDAQRALQEDRNEHPDWTIITAFYQTLHWVDAFFLTKENEPNNHQERGNYIKNTEELEGIAKNYWTLKNASQMARYEEATFKDDPAKVEELLEISCSIINYIKALMDKE